MSTPLTVHLQQDIITLSLIDIDFQIEKYQMKIISNKNIIENINKLYLSKEYLIFSRLDTSDNSDINKCNFCSKFAHYIDIENKYYCWFHRSQYELV